MLGRRARLKRKFRRLHKEERRLQRFLRKKGGLGRLVPGHRKRQDRRLRKIMGKIAVLEYDLGEGEAQQLAGVPVVPADEGLPVVEDPAKRGTPPYRVINYAALPPVPVVQWRNLNIGYLSAPAPKGGKPYWELHLNSYWAAEQGLPGRVTCGKATTRNGAQNWCKKWVTARMEQPPGGTTA